MTKRVSIGMKKSSQICNFAHSFRRKNARIFRGMRQSGSKKMCNFRETKNTHITRQSLRNTAAKFEIMFKCDITKYIYWTQINTGCPTKHDLSLIHI